MRTPFVTTPRAINPEHDSVSTNRHHRILILNWRDHVHPNAGGAEMYTQRVAMEWVKMGHSVTLFCSSAPGYSSDEVVNGLRTIRRGSKHTVYREAKHFYRREGRGQYDLIIDEVNTRPFLTPKWVKDASSIALIHQVCRNIWFYEYSLPIALVGRFILEPWWLRAYRNVPTITVSPSSANSLKCYGLHNIKIIPEGMDQIISDIEIKRETEPTLIFVGRLAANKRPNEAIEAFRFVRQEIPTAKMWIIGSGPMESNLRKLPYEGIEFLGRVSEVEKRARLARAHILVVTSVREGWGLVVTEAAQCGTIAVGYDVPGLRDSIQASGGQLSASEPFELGQKIINILSKSYKQRIKNVAPSGVATWSHVAQEILQYANDELGR